MAQDGIPEGQTHIGDTRYGNAGPPEPVIGNDIHQAQKQGHRSQYTVAYEYQFFPYALVMLNHRIIPLIRLRHDNAVALQLHGNAVCPQAAEKTFLQPGILEYLGEGDDGPVAEGTHAAFGRLAL